MLEVSPVIDLAPDTLSQNIVLADQPPITAASRDINNSPVFTPEMLAELGQEWKSPMKRIPLMSEWSERKINAGDMERSQSNLHDNLTGIFFEINPKKAMIGAHALKVYSPKDLALRK